MIELRGLHRRFGARIAVEAVDLTVAPGEVLGLLGPNGAGKTTTLRMITGYLEPTRGTVLVDGHDVARDPLAVRRRLGYLPEGAPLWPESTPDTLLAFCARIHGLDRTRARRRRAEITERLQLGAVLHQRCETLSRGFRRRVALAVAVLHDPPLLVLDEPTEGLDPNQKHEVRTLLGDLAGERTVILSTHLLEEVEPLCTRGAILHEGRLVADEPPACLRARSRWAGAVTVRFAGEQPAVAVLSGLPSVAAVEPGPGGEGWTLFPRRDDQAPHTRLSAAVTDLARARGLDLLELHVHAGRLDDVFGDLTGRGAQA